MSKPQKVPDVRIINGVKVHVVSADAANDDPIRAYRLQKKAEAGDAEAARELEELFNTPMYEVVKREDEE